MRAKALSLTLLSLPGENLGISVYARKCTKTDSCHVQRFLSHLIQPNEPLDLTAAVRAFISRRSDLAKAGWRGKIREEREEIGSFCSYTLSKSHGL